MSGAALRTLCATRLTEMEAACASVRALIETPASTNVEVITPLEITLTRGVDYLRRHLNAAIAQEQSLRRSDADKEGFTPDP
ncbi:MAG: hypothetical protein HS104_09620 [Polyangiaceae bacterium]|nr:hypothetical protein [Polyangiaceae bacterium]MCE7890757.1 hypothetical protein [Sorangiineae bacterium PRO1]MCL4754345.1 hypothetical protein [Myxococcales bacterium]